MHAKIVVGDPEENRPLARPGRRWEDTIKMDMAWRVLGLRMERTASTCGG